MVAEMESQNSHVCEVHVLVTKCPKSENLYSQKGLGKPVSIWVVSTAAWSSCDSAVCRFIDAVSKRPMCRMPCVV